METFVDRLTSDKRRVYREFQALEPPSPVKRARLQGSAITNAATPAPALTIDVDDRYAMGLQDDTLDGLGENDEQGVDEIPETVSATRTVKPSDPVMRDWLLNHRDAYLSVLLWREGCGSASVSVCPRCLDPSNTPHLRCRDCKGGLLLCTACCLDVHIEHPLHVIEVILYVDCKGGLLLCTACCLDVHIEHPLHVIEAWTGVYFKKKSLKDIGLRIQLGHPPRENCIHKYPGHEEFVVLHDNGIHVVSVDFCGCVQRQVPWHIQLLRMGWYPATTNQPKTCATFACLGRFHSLSLYAKTTAYDFYSTLEYLTDGTCLKPPNRYQIFLRVARQYRHLLLLKRGGRGHDKSGVWGTRPGELAIRCPACPRPGGNLPADWEEAPPEKQLMENRGLYVQFLALDACFRLKRRTISSELKDPGLGTGWAYMVEWEPYRQFLLTVTDQEEMSTCTGLAALDYANTKFSRGYSATGVGMGVCARHEFVQPNGVADLQRGERYANMDYIYASLLRHIDPRLRKITSYDIVCQWWKQLRERLLELPPLVRLKLVLDMCRFVIPKMHIKGHTLGCQLLYSLNLVPGSGQTDGEGSRADQLDDHWTFWNWTKLVGLAALLRRRLDAAKVELAKQEEAFEAFSCEQSAKIPLWKSMVVEFERDGSKKNPYEAAVNGTAGLLDSVGWVVNWLTGLTEMQVRLRLESEEAAEAAAAVVHDVTLSGFIMTLLDLEDQQRRVRVQVELKRAKSTALKINLRSLRRKLNLGIQRLRGLQATFMPAALTQLKALKMPPETQAEEVPLIPPSALTESQRDGGGCWAGLLEMEKEMRDAQCRSALVRLRNQLHIKSRFLLYKKNHARHQARNTRSRTIVARNEAKIRLHSEKYQAAWRALVSISGGVEGAVGWKRLKREDIRCMQDAAELSRREEKRRRQQVRQEKRDAELRAAGELPLVTSRLMRGTNEDEWVDVDDDNDTFTLGRVTGRCLGFGRWQVHQERMSNWKKLSESNGQKHGPEPGGGARRWRPSMRSVTGCRSPSRSRNRSGSRVRRQCRWASCLLTSRKE
ncbi:hypothetical protein GGX14DRAFT_389351 [Mycena pura]|uniref:CxC2-like cysteine cluster KDZ transposase-associated domain-containing protein n=1 Tax=Mycena pura TaxID=153505 RepID=A0AAD6VTC0_9AGAR|nr:hypothetical protein GGX14DRAFT_389351 [Mycena pura]